MFFMNAIRTCCVLLLLCLCSGCYPAATQSGYVDFREVESPQDFAVHRDTKALRVAIASVLLPQENIMHYRAIADYLGRKLNRPVILLQRRSYAEIALLLLNGGADMAFFSSGGYANYIGLEDITLLASQQRMGMPWYQGYLLVHRDSPIRSVDDLRGRTVAFTDPLSYSGHAFLEYELFRRGETPEKFLDHYIYTYSHDSSFRAVLNHVVDAAPVSRIVYDRAKERQPELADMVRIIAVSAQAGTAPVVAGKTLPPAQQDRIRELLLVMHEAPEMKAPLESLSIDCFVAPQPELFTPVRDVLRMKRGAL